MIAHTRDGGRLQRLLDVSQARPGTDARYAQRKAAMSSRTNLLNQFEAMVNETSPDEVITGFAAVEHSRPGTRYMIRVHTAQKVQIHTITSGWLNITVQRTYGVWVDEGGHMDHGLSEKPTVVVA